MIALVQADDSKYGHRLECLKKLTEKLNYNQHSTWPMGLENEAFVSFIGRDYPSYNAEYEKYKYEKNSPARDKALSSYFFLFSNDRVRWIPFPNIRSSAAMKVDALPVVRYKIDGKIYYASLDILMKDLVDEKGTYSVESYNVHRTYLKNHPDAKKEKNQIDYYFEAAPITDEEMLKAAESSLNYEIENTTQSLAIQMKVKIRSASLASNSSACVVQEPDVTEEMHLFEECASPETIANYKTEVNPWLENLRNSNDFHKNR